MDLSALAHSITGKSLEACSIEEIKQLTETYPYFAPAQFLYVLKLKEENATETQEAERKAALYHHNILELDRILNPDRYANSFEPEPIEPLQENTEEVKLPENATVQPQTTGLSFEPYHLVDYFASQGIKLSKEEESKDEFGKQLKSFTEWLKTMKRLPVSQMVANLDSSSENKVLNLAQHSVHESDILTEAMAEVWLKQGNKEKAIDIYNKLSLQNPSKKPYFAALIEKLK
jgi:hypothetical protein